MNRLLLIGIAIVVVVVLIVLALILIQHPPPAIVVNASYAFIVGENGQWFVEWFGQNGSLHMLGPFNNLNDPDIIQAMSVVSSFNQQIVPQHSSYQPLDSIIVVGAGDTGKQGVVEIPVSGNTIELNQVNPEYYTLITVPQQYATQFMQALDTGYKLSATVGLQGANYLQYHDPQIWKLVLEMVNLQQYSSSSGMALGGRFVLETNNNTLIPWGFLYSTSQYSYGTSLPFIKEISINAYNGS